MYIQNEESEDVREAIATVTSFERYLIENVLMSEAPMSNRGIVLYLKEDGHAKQFADDEVSSKAKITGNYIEKRINAVKLELASNMKIKKHMPAREQFILEVDAEQALDADIANAAELGDLFD